MTENLESTLLKALDEKQVIDNSYDFALSLHADHQAVVGVIKSLEADLLIATEQLSQQFWELTEEAHSVIQHGSPEIRVLKCIPAEGIDNESLIAAAGKETHKIGFSYCMKNKWVKKDKTSGLITPLVTDPKDELQEVLLKIEQSNGSTENLAPASAEAKQLIRRQMLSLVVRKYYKVSKGEKFALERHKQVADITKEMLESGEEIVLKPYNFCAL